MHHERCLSIPPLYKDNLRFLFLAKHALSGGNPDVQDGNHAVYHHELFTTLQSIGLNITGENSFSALYQKPDFDFLISLYNRAGFRNSEMFAPLFAEYHRIPYLGGTPMVRGITDDKHVMKRIIQALGIKTPDWKLYPVGGLDETPPAFPYDGLVVKPNASSASWGIAGVEDWQAALPHICALHLERHDVIVEAYVDGYDVAVPVIGSNTPWYLPVIRYGEFGDMRSYEEKRGLANSSMNLEVVHDEVLKQQLISLSELVLNEIWPFDHGRLEYRINPRNGEIHFIEININCNLWSAKSISTAARHLGVTHSELVETILCHSLLRQGVIPDARALAA